MDSLEPLQGMRGPVLPAPAHRENIHPDAAITTVVTLYRIHATAARAEADNDAQVALAFKSVNGCYPANLVDAGVASGADRWKVACGVDERGRPWLIYPATFVVFESWSYDFSALKWSYFPD